MLTALLTLLRPSAVVALLYQSSKGGALIESLKGCSICRVNGAIDQMAFLADPPL